MKYSFVTLAAVAGAALAAPPPSAIDNFGPDFFTPFCNLDYKGKPCEELVGKGDKNADAICKAGREHFCGPQKRDAVPEPQPDPVADPMPWCTWRGQPCWKEKMKAKREAEAIPEPIAAPQPDPVADPMPWCTWRGQPCWKEKMAKREAIPEPVAAPQPDPVAEPMPWCTWRGQPCWKEKMRMAKREPEPVAAPQPDPVAEPMPWCTWRGQPCWKEKMRMAKREAIPEPAPEAENEPRWCLWRGQPCWKKTKRDATPEPWCLWRGQPCWKAKRDAAPEPWCMWRGQPCWKAKRDAGQALSNALHATRSLDTRSADAPSTAHLPRDAPHKAKRSIVELANLIALSARGSPEEYFKSLELETFFPDAAPNATAKRDLNTLQEDKRWCMWRGQPCWKAKRAAEAVLDAVDGDDGATGPGGPDSHYDTRDFKSENFAAKRDLIAIKAAARSIADMSEE
ncbi:hypothetical protein FOYG_05476 [Fusarium oxysporum NRRL 32931]|uniref:Pheromone protein 1 n=1 Tax=Fusarium oxysporum NRRL 32931 TaxID=660029 RepID=W9IPZ3_FUSOX|nr:hypothetical protein FOYG_05476 [Fusarium oxysporum NRRL 32931]